MALQQEAFRLLPNYDQAKAHEVTSIRSDSLLDAKATTQTGQRKAATRWQRFSPVTALLIPTLASAIVLALTVSDYRSTSAVYRWSIHNRASLQIGVHLVASSLAWPWTYAITQTFNLYTRTTVWDRPISFNVLRFWTSMSHKRLDWGLSPGYVGVCALLCSLYMIPNFLWIGAITPQLTTLESSGFITVLRSGEGSWPVLQDRADCSSTSMTPDSPGFFTTCPGTYQSGAILQSGAAAITLHGSQRNHSKPDNTGYAFHGRSYGVGASVGWTQNEPADGAAVKEFVYRETGYSIEVSCAYNQSAMWVITNNLTAGQAGLPNSFAAQGWLPNDNWTAVPDNLNISSLRTDFLYGRFDAGWYAQVAFEAGGSLVAMAGRNDARQSDKLMVAIAARSRYPNLDKIQCELFSNPTDFSITVSPIERSLQVTPGASVVDPEPRGILKRKVVGSFMDISKTETTLWTSSVGDAFNASISTLWARTYGVERLPSSRDDERLQNITLRAVEQSFIAMADDMLVRMSSAAIATNTSNELRETKQYVSAVQIGVPLYVYAIAVIHIASLMCLGVFSAIHGFWQNTPIFDYADPINLAVGMLAGSRSQREGDLADMGLNGWDGDPDVRVIRRMKVRIGVGEGGEVMVATTTSAGPA